MRIDSICGGTDVCTAFFGGSALLPVVAGEIACRWLGVDARARGADGRDLVGEVGEFVVAAPMPSMPIGLWGDDDGSRLRAAYFDAFPGVWRQGDWITISERGSVTVSGRSDATLNRGGVRIGSAEIYAVVEALPRDRRRARRRARAAGRRLLAAALRRAVRRRRGRRRAANAA